MLAISVSSHTEHHQVSTHLFQLQCIFHRLSLVLSRVLSLVPCPVPCPVPYPKLLFFVVGAHASVKGVHVPLLPDMLYGMQCESPCDNSSFVHAIPALVDSLCLLCHVVLYCIVLCCETNSLTDCACLVFNTCTCESSQGNASSHSFHMFVHGVVLSDSTFHHVDIHCSGAWPTQSCECHAIHSAESQPQCSYCIFAHTLQAAATWLDGFISFFLAISLVIHHPTCMDVWLSSQ